MIRFFFLQSYLSTWYYQSVLSPTDAQENCFKRNIKFYIKTAPTHFGLITIVGVISQGLVPYPYLQINLLSSISFIRHFLKSLFFILSIVKKFYTAIFELCFFDLQLISPFVDNRIWKSPTSLIRRFLTSFLFVFLNEFYIARFTCFVICNYSLHLYKLIMF
jgi:hypothetical protein